MAKKLTISELREYVKKEAVKLYENAINEFGFSQDGEAYGFPEDDTLEHPSDIVHNEVFNDIEMQLRPNDTTLSYDEIQDIANSHGVDMEYVVGVMQDYVRGREQMKSKELEDDVKWTIDEYFNGQAPVSFKDFYNVFSTQQFDNDYGQIEVRNMFTKLTTDPNQLALFERLLKEGLAGMGTGELDPDYFQGSSEYMFKQEPNQDTVEQIIGKLKENGTYVFDKYSDPKAYQVQDELKRQNIEYGDTSETGSNLIIYLIGHPKTPPRYLREETTQMNNRKLFLTNPKDFESTFDQVETGHHERSKTAKNYLEYKTRKQILAELRKEVMENGAQDHITILYYVDYPDGHALFEKVDEDETRIRYEYTGTAS